MNDSTQSVLSLLAEHGPRLHATLLRITLREDVAEDLMQELFLRLNRRNALERATDPLGYALRTATRLAFDWRRSQRRRIDNELIDEEPHRDSKWEHRQLVQREDLNILLTAMDQLSTVSRDIIVMHYLEEQSYEEIASVLGKTPHQTRALCSKAMEKLRVRFNPNSAKKMRDSARGDDHV